MILSALQWDQPEARVSPDWIGLILAILWLTWMFSALLRYWGPRRTTTLMGDRGVHFHRGPVLRRGVGRAPVEDPSVGRNGGPTTGQTFRPARGIATSSS